jgi:hypothetical protein
MIKLSKKTLGLIQAEAAKPHIQAAAADETLSKSHFSPELQGALAEDASVDGTGAVMIPQIASLVGQLVGLFVGGLKSAPTTADVVKAHQGPVATGPVVTK